MLRLHCSFMASHTPGEKEKRVNEIIQSSFRCTQIRERTIFLHRVGAKQYPMTRHSPLMMDRPEMKGTKKKED